MRSGLRIFLLLSILTLTACAPNPNRVQSLDTHLYSSDGSHLVEADPDTVTFEQEVRGHLAMPDEEQAVVREMAEKKVEEWRAFQGEARNRHDSIYRQWYHDGSTRWAGQFQGVGVGTSISVLKEAGDTDPSFVEAWTALGDLCNHVGDWESALAHFDRARVAADVRREFDRPVDREVELELYRGRAWALRDLARWDEGIIAVKEGLALRSGDQELVLIYGLLLAGAGRYEEAMSVAVRMPPMEYPQYNFIFYGLKKQASIYANNWIRSQAMLAEGDYEGARWILGDMEFYPYRGLLLHSARYWRDVGLAAELAGDPKAPTYYALGHITREYWGFYPVTADALGALVLDVPDYHQPVFTSYGRRFYAGGSYLTYIAAQMTRMAQARFPGEKEDAVGRALQALQIAERRNIRPDVCRALRGRLYYYNDDLDAARTELLAARTAFKVDGTIDPGTSLLLGMLEMQGGRNQGAARFLEEAVAEDPDLAVGWRSLGVVYDRLGLLDRAQMAMDKSIDLEPRSVAGRYNRGVFHMRAGRNDLAVEDLRIVLYLEPENREAQRMLTLAGGTPPGEGDPLPMALAADGQEDPEVLMAKLEGDIEEFFSQADSTEVDRDNLDASIRDLEAKYVADPDVAARKILALAYIDAKRFEEAQQLLAPGWGVDLEPDDEVMLLYVDHVLGERTRARDLADKLVRGERSPDNPYAIAMAAMIIKGDPRGGPSKVDVAFYKRMGYGDASSSWTSAFAFSDYMRVGFANYRGSKTHGNTYMLPMPMSADPFFRGLASARANSPVGQGLPTYMDSKK